MARSKMQYMPAVGRHGHRRKCPQCGKLHWGAKDKPCKKCAEKAVIEGGKTDLPKVRHGLA
ncbi:MAG: hypothetical protein NC238_08970 [Dehalobacter sp.]|nr:hypothetical protein [Dehalobacter sp.]